MAAKTTKELSDEEIEDYKEAFSNFDKDGNGNIDEGELGVVMRSLGYSPTNQQLKEMMAKVCRSMLYAEVYRARPHALMLYTCMTGFCCPRMHHVEIILVDVCIAHQRVCICTVLAAFRSCATIY